MKVVLLDDIVNLGEAGEVVDVKNGFARNWLIPRGLAETATRDSVNRVGLIKRAAESKRVKRLTEASDKFNALAEKQLVLNMKAGTEGRIFGAVTSAMIADEVQIQFGVTLDRRHVMLEEPIKQLGEFSVPLRAGANTTGEIKVLVQAELKRGQLRDSTGPTGPVTHFDDHDERPRRGRRRDEEREEREGAQSAEDSAAEETTETAEADADEKYADIAEQAEES
jgi:large subunit ribosomal protein L9